MENTHTHTPGGVPSRRKRLGTPLGPCPGRRSGGKSRPTAAGCRSPRHAQTATCESTGLPSRAVRKPDSSRAVQNFQPERLEGVPDANSGDQSGGGGRVAGAGAGIAGDKVRAKYRA